MNSYPNYISLSDTVSGGSLPLTTRGDLVTRDASDDIRLAVGANGEVLKSDGTDVVWGTVAGTGDVVGPASSTDNAMAIFDGITGILLKDSAIIVKKDVSNIVIGGTSGSLTGVQNTLIGDSAYAIAAGSSNCCVGVSAGDEITTGSQNTAVGHSALTANSTSSGSTAFGSAALQLSTATGNTAVGENAGNSITSGGTNTCIGADSDAAATLSNQTAIGHQATSDTANQVMIGNASVTQIVPNASAAVSLGSETNTFSSAYLEDITEPTITDTGTGVLFKKTGDDGLFWKPGSGTAVDLTASGGFTDPMTTRGDVIIRNAANATARLGIGTASQVLTSDGTDISWSAVAGTGDVVGPGSAVDNNLCSFDTTTGKLIQDSGLLTSNVVDLATAQTLINKTVTDLKLTDSASDNTYQILTPDLVADRIINLPLLTATDTFTADNHASTMANKTFITPKIWDATGFDFSYALTTPNLAADRILNLPLLTGTDTITCDAHASTLTNKTLTSPIISTISNTGTLTLPTSTDVLVGRDTTDTLTNKTIGVSQLSGQVSIANGGTNGATSTAGFDNLAPTTTRGDLITRDATNNVRLAIGTNTQVLTSDGTDFAWATPSGGFSDPMTTQGDIIIRNTANSTVRLAKGTAAQVLTMNAGATEPEWAAAGGGGGGSPITLGAFVHATGWTSRNTTLAFLTVSGETFLNNADWTMDAPSAVKFTYSGANETVLVELSQSYEMTTIARGGLITECWKNGVKFSNEAIQTSGNTNGGLAAAGTLDAQWYVPMVSGDFIQFKNAQAYGSAIVASLNGITIKISTIAF